MCFHFGLSAVLQFKKMHEFKQGSDLFSETLQRCAHILQPGLHTVILKDGSGERAFTGVCAIYALCQYFNMGATFFRLSASSILN